MCKLCFRTANTLRHPYPGSVREISGWSMLNSAHTFLLAQENRKFYNWDRLTRHYVLWLCWKNEVFLQDWVLVFYYLMDSVREGSPVVVLYFTVVWGRDKVLLLVMLCVLICSPYILLINGLFGIISFNASEGMDFCTKKPYYSFARLFLI